MIDILFPWKLHLTILQLEEYKSWRFIHWIQAHFLARSIETKRKLAVTPKIKMILLWAFITLFVISFGTFLLTQNVWLTIIVACIGCTQPWIFLTAGLFALLPYEITNKYKTINAVKEKLRGNKNIKIVGFSGSYGKTSTKELLYQLLRDDYKVLRTPESYNTIFGIAKVVNFEFDNSYDIFLCELGEYKKGEVKQLCDMVNPQYGIVTGITKQHFERFKSLEAITQTIFELPEYIKQKEHIALNINSPEIDSQKNNYPRAITYGGENAMIQIVAVMFGKKETELTIKIDKKVYKTYTQLFGFSAIANLSGAIAAARLLGVNVEEIVKKIPNLLPFDHRYERRQIGKATIVDNTYSSNLVGFEETIKTAKTIKILDH
jgi:UDP-N-acetylmuramoyl-tripeptide--D-alanyl-D-alanine ligase